MSVVHVEVGSGYTQVVNKIAIECPFCHTKITPQYLFLHDTNLFAYCPNSDCNKHFVLLQDLKGDYSVVQPNSVPSKKQFSKIIKHVSSSFTDIYNQAFFAEQLSLNQICGTGYRKALEFLIKDYLLSNLSEDESEKAEKIKKKFLGKCISEDVSNEKIKIVAQRAAWLGNDETHYVRLWNDKDVSYLKGLIDLTIRWIESEVETQQLLADMPDAK